MKIAIPILLLVLCFTGFGQQGAEQFPVRGLCIGAPAPDEVEAFIDFIENDLTEWRVNTLVLMVNYGFKFRSHPEISTGNALTREDARQLADACRKQGIKLVPQVNLLGHQSWAGTTGALLRVHPEFDETPGVEMPEKYVWPNEDGLYCKSYCPLHPGVHEVVFDLVDEVMEAFGADAFHAGMDEVFYIGHEDCPRCSGKDRSELFAGEVTLIRDHLAAKGQELWIWGDRLLDGSVTGLGLWEASENDTHRAIDMIPKDVMIWDWHYERAEPTAVYFAMKGFRVVSCCWNRPEVAVAHREMVTSLREQSNPVISSRILGVAQTVWNGSSSFIRLVDEPDQTHPHIGTVNSFMNLFAPQTPLP